MTAIERVAFFLDSNDDQPNIELARRLAETNDAAGIGEIAAGLDHENKLVAGDCIKVLYEIGSIEPCLIAPYVADFLRLIESRTNRLVWGGMTALSTIAAIRPDDIYKKIDAVLRAFDRGSTITVDRSITVLAELAKADRRYRARLFPVIEEHLSTCRPKDVPQHAERASVCVDRDNRTRFLAILQQRRGHLTAPQAKRVDKLIQQISGR
jgi:hypothetical protein